MTSDYILKTLVGGGRDEMACQLSRLLYQRKHGFLSQADYEATLEHFESMWAPNSTLNEAMMADGGTRFVLRDNRTGVILESFLFRRYH